MRSIRYFALASLTAAAAAPLNAQTARSFDLSVENLMRGPDLYGYAPSMVRFSDDSRWIWFRWRRPGVDTIEASYRVPATGGTPVLVDSASADSLYPQPGTWSPDRKLKVFTLRGDLYLWDATRGTRRRLTQTQGARSNVSFAPDGRTVFFVQSDNAYALSLDEPMLRQLTDIRRGPAPRGLAARDTTGQRGALRDDQRRLFDFVRNPPRNDNPFRTLPADSALPRPLYLEERQSIAGLEVSPDQRTVLVTIAERPANALTQTLPVWITETGYIETRPNRTKVGDEQNSTKAGFLDVATGAVRWVDPGLGRRRVDVSGIAWSTSGRYALLRGRSKDLEDRWLWTIGVTDSAPQVVDLLHDAAWVGGLSNAAGWIRGEETVWFASERSGFAHLYTVPATGAAQPRAVTAADRRFEARQISQSVDGRRFFYHSNETHFGEQHCYAIGADGSGAEQLTRSEGREDCIVSPDERTLAIMHSTSNHPPELYVQPVRGGRMTQVTESTSEDFRRYAWRVPELVMVTARDGAQVPARLFRPARPNGAGVVFVHGAGYLQEAHKWWSDYPREYMFDHLLAERGYTVIDMDYRASAGLGRDWRTGIYRHMGGTDLDDVVDGAKWLVHNAGVDSTRIGLWGGSYGGFITLMALFTQPDIFRSGAALRPVTDWAHYNHGYTAGILNEPQEDSVAYRQSSPIFFAEGLRGHLLIAHGMVDDNVNFQDAVRLVQRLIELGKDNWELAVYPVEPHGFRRTSSWVDEYRRILRLFETTLRGSGGSGLGARD